MKILNSRFKILGVTLAIGAVFALFQFVGFKTSLETERIIYPQAQLVPLTPNKTLFKSNEAPQFTLKLGQKQEERQLISSPLKTAFAETEPEVIAKVYYGNEQMNDQVNPEIQKNGGDEYNITLPQPKSFRPGKYTLQVTLKENGAYQNFNQDFRWGVLAINTNKSIFKEYETAKIYFGVLDESGHTICDAKLRLQILNPKSEILNFSTEDGTIKYSGECARDNVTYTPDYSAIYKVGGEGIYQMALTAQTQKGEYQIADFFEVRKEVPFEIERIGPTRINPVAAYDFKIKIKANQDFVGEVIESVPDSYQTLNSKSEILNKFEIRNSNEQNEKLLVWQVNWQAGKTYELSYTFDAPDISPYLYLLGPLELRINSFQDLENSPQIISEKIGPLDIERTGPTQVSPDIYEIRTRTKVREDFEGLAIDLMPDEFDILEEKIFKVTGSEKELLLSSNQPSDDNAPVTISTLSEGKIKEIVWKVPWEKDKTYEFLYQFDIRNFNPDLINDFLKFTVANDILDIKGQNLFDWGKLNSNQSSNKSNLIFTEARQWQIAADATAGPNNPSAAVTDSASGGTINWLNPTYVFTNDNVYYATASLTDNEISYYIKATGFGFDIPPGSEINGILVEVDRKASFADRIKDHRVRIIRGGVIGTTDKADTVNWWPTADAYAPYGGSADLWGESWTVADINASNFGVAFSAQKPTTLTAAYTASVDHIQITVYYTPPAPTITVSGTVRQTDELNPLTAASGTTVTIISEGQSAQTTTVQSGGTYTKSGITVGSAGNAILVYLDDNASYKGSVVTVANDTTSNIDNLDIFQNRVIATSNKTSTSITNTDFGDVDQSDTDDLYSVASGALTISSGYELHVYTGKTFDPNGTVTTNATSGVFHIDNSAIAYLDTNGSIIGNNINIDSGATLNIDANTVAQGNITIDGSLTKSTGSPTLTLRGTNNISGAGATKSFYILAVGDATATSATTISSSITVAGGALTTFGGSTIATSGTPNVNISAGTGNIGGGSGSISFYDLTIGGTQTLQSNIAVSNNLSVSGSLALNNKDIGITNGNFATTGSGIITCTSCSAGTATLSGTGNIGGGGTVIVYNLTVNGSYTLQTATTANNDVSVGTGATLALNGKDLTVSGGDLTTTTTGQITCASCSTGTTTVNGSAATGIGGGSGGITFYNLTIGGMVPILSTITVSNDLTANGTMSGSVNVTVNGNVAGTGTINMSGGTFDQRVAAAKNFGTTSGSNSWTFSTLKFTNSSSASRTITTQAASGGITVSTLLQIGNDGPTDTYPTVLDAGNRTWTLSATNGTPFDIKTSTNGISTLTGSTSTFTYTGVYGGGDTTVQSTTGSSYYYNLIFNGAETYAAEGAVIVNNDLTVTTGTFSLGANNLTVGTDSTTGDIAVAGSLTQSASGTTTVKTFNANTAVVGGTGTLTFYHLALSPTNAGGTIRLGSGASQTITVLGNLTVGNGSQSVIVDADTNDPTLSISGNFSISSSGTFQAPSYTTESFTIGGTYNNSGTFTHNSGKITFNGSGTGKTLTGTMTGTSSFNNLTFNGSSGVSWTFGSNSATVANDLSIAANNTVTAPSATLTITGNYSNSGTFTHNGGAVTFNAADTGNTLSGAMTGSSAFNNLEFNNSAGAWSFGANNATVINNFTITNTTAVGGVTAPSTTLIIGGNLTKSAGTFSHNNGTVAFNDNSKNSTLTYNAAITFYGFSVTTDNKQLYFDNVDQTNVTNSFTINPSGANCAQMVKIWSDSSGNQYDLNVTAASPTIQYADVKDSNAVISLTASNSKSSGNISGWNITGGVCGGVTISGTAYSSETSGIWANCGASSNISLVVNGSLAQTTTCSGANGSFNFYTVTVAQGNPVSVFFNATDKGVAVTVAADSSSNISSLAIIPNRVWIKAESGVTSITNANLHHCDKNVTNCGNIPYDADASNNLTIDSGVELHVASSTYYPGATVSTNATGGDLHVDDNATAYLDTTGTSIGRDALVDGGATLEIQANTNIGRHITTSGTSPTVTYTNTPTVTLSGTSTVGGGTTPSITFYNLTVNGTMSGSSNITANGAVAGTGTISMSAGTTFEQRVAANQNFGTTSGINNWTFATLIFSNSDGVNPHTITTQSASGGITVSTLLQIGKAGDGQATTLNAGNRTWTLQGTDGTPFDIIGSSVLTGSTSTFTYTGVYGSGDTIVQSTIGSSYYYNLTFNGAETYAAEGAIVVNNDLAVTTGTFSLGGNNLTVGSDSTTGDISVAASQSLTQSASGTTTVKTFNANTAIVGGAGTLTFYNLSLSPTNSGGTIRLGSAGGQTLTVNNDFTVSNGSNSVTVDADTNDPTLDINGNFAIDTNGIFQASQTGTFQVAKNFTNNGTFTHNSGTVTFDTTNTTTFDGSGTPAITFFSFESTTPGKTLVFTASKVFRVEGIFTVNGQSGNKITINSTSGTQWQIDHQGTESVTYANIQNSGCAVGTTTISLDPTNSDAGNNGTCWAFQIGKRVKAGVRIKGGVTIK